MDEDRDVSCLRVPALQALQDGLGEVLVIGVRLCQRRSMDSVLAVERSTNDVEDDVRRFSGARDLLGVLMRANDGLHAVLGLEDLRLSLVTDESGDVEALPVGVVQEACEDGTADVA